MEIEEEKVYHTLLTPVGIGTSIIKPESCQRHSAVGSQVIGTQ